tara:strand:+ start:269 stop:454 length:186 start_codon:yes stop_codon:yes gene_type:complete
VAKRKSKPWGIWVTSSKQWMTTGDGSRKARYELQRDASKEANEFNTMWRSRKHIYEARKIK